METYIWNHEPNLSAEPVERIFHDYKENDDEIDESGLFSLANGKFLCIKIKGIKSNPSLGITELDEFEKFEEAKRFYIENYQE